jgi:hypothetical protein
MKHFMVVAAVLVIIALNAPALHSAGGSPDQNSSAQQARRLLLINTVRSINVAEVEQQTATGKFADWKTLAESNPLRKMGVQIPAQTNVRVFTDPDGKYFSVLLADKQDPCLYTVFSDETGFIYQGQTAQCANN